MNDSPVPPRVFIIDPSAAVIQRLAALLDGTAHVVGYATTAYDAISGVRRTNPHLAVLDIGITNGIDLLKKIRNHQPPVVVAILTHSIEEVTRHVCRRLGAEYFLDKISEFDKVREIIIANGGGWRHTAWQ